VSPAISLPAALVAGATRLHLPDLMALAASPDAVPWVPFRPGVDIHRLYGDGETGPSAALLRFEVGGEVPMHRHLGYEHIFVLTGSQRDSGGLAEAGSLLIHAPGSKHRVWSDTGCVVLAVYERPVEFLE
jgi:anti-sigma factor ChrR (cupin superfamily)